MLKAPLKFRKVFWYTLDCMQGKVFTGVFTQYGRRVRVSVKIRVRFRFICVWDPTCSHSLAVYSKEYSL